MMAAVSGCFFGIVTFWLTRHARSGRVPALLAACIFPFASLAWGGLVFAFQGLVNQNVSIATQA
jgi:hypothetical protein